MQRKTKTFCTVLGFSLAWFLVAGVVSSTPVSAYTASITTNDSIVLDASPAGNGISSVEESINVVSDCRNGYNLTIATPEGSSLYKYNNGTQVGTASFTAVDGTSAISSSNNTNKWGYSLSSAVDSNTVFLPLSSTASVLKTSSQTASPSADINDTFNISYGIKVDDTITPGSYQMANQGSIVYYLTMDTTCTQYTVAFNANGGTGTVANQGIETGVATKLSSAESLTAPTGASYTDADNNTITGSADKLWTFWGWNTQADGTGDWYKDREAVTDLASVGSTITLYAQWKQATLADMVPGTPVDTEKVIDHNEMQDMRPEVCYNSDITTSANAPAATLLDYRGKVTTGDNPELPESYTVSKLADGNCWMTTNLNLGRESGGSNGNGTVTLTSEDTDLLDDITFTLPASTTTSSTTATNATIRLTNTSDATTNGVYYSWAAAVANTTSISTNPITSICPRNWDLPASSQYTNLSTKSSYSSSNSPTNAPSSFLATGKFTNGATFYPTSSDYGFYWSSTSSSTTAAYGARVTTSALSTSSSTGTTYGGNKYYRKNIRCVASNGKVTINYDGNGTTEYPVTGTTASQTNIEINSANIMTNGFTRTNWTFKNWNTSADGTGTTIAAGAAIYTLGLKPGETITLYAQWLPQYTITYVNNCQTYASSNSACTQSVSDGTSEQKINLTNDPSTGTETGTLAAYNKWTLTGWKIKGWSTVADNSDGTNTEYTVGSTYTVPAGSSVGDGITLYAHWVPVYSIQYDGNGASNPNGMGTTDQSTGVKSVKQTNVGEGDPVILLASNFKRAGYGFAGWSTNPNATVTSGDKVYGPMETIEAPAYPTNGTNIITMYAVWVPAEKSDPSDPSSGPLYLQDFTASDCSALTSASFNTATGEITPGSVIALTDKRDDEVYTIAKLADDNCWMVENLRLEHEGTVGNNKNDTSVTNQSLSQGYGGTPGTYGSFVGLAASESANFSNSTTSLSFADGGMYKSSLASPTDTYNPSTSTLEDIGTSNYPGYRFPRYNNSNISSALQSPTFTENYANATSPSTSGTYRTSTVSSYGNYYTWAAAMANTNYYTSSSTSEAANTSICPANWTLPTSDTATKEYGTLSQRYGGTGSTQSGAAQFGDIMSKRFRTFPNNFLYSGNFGGSSAVDRGSYGYYWSRSAYGLNYSYRLFLDSTHLYPSYSYTYKYLGFSVRCLVDNTYTIQYDGNGADNPNGMGTTDAGGKKSVKQIGISDGTKVTLLASNFKRAGYGFVGWSTDSDAWTHFTDNDNTNDPIIYGPMEDVTVNTDVISSSRKGIITLYAVWVPAEKDGNNNPVYLQEWDDPTDANDGCTALTATTFNNTITDEKGKIAVNKNSIIALTDKRDNMVYAIAKLADGNCWMIENLRLDDQYTKGQNQNDNTVTNGMLAQGYGGTAGTYGSFVGLANSESSNFSSTTSNTIYKSDAASPTDTYDGNGTLEDIGSSDSPQYRFPRYNNDNTLSLVDSTTYTQDYSNASSPSDSGTNYRTSSNLYSYGNYYTWTAAMANTNYYSDSSTSEVASTSICPSGWHLPSSNGTAKEYGILSTSYGGNGGSQSGIGTGDIMSNRFRTFPNNFLYSGNFSDSSASSRGSYGRYWSRSAHSGSYRNFSFSLDLFSTYADPSGSMSRNSGLSVRCISGSPYYIQYDGNGSDNDSTGMGTNPAGYKSVGHANVYEGSTFDLFASNFKKAGYGFVGWSLDQNAWSKLTDNDPANDEKIWGPNETMTAPVRPDNGTDILTLYAVWAPAETSGGNPVYLQDWSGCSAMTATTYDSTAGTLAVAKNSITALTDARDNQVYAVAKLTDDNCWMIENLRLDNTPQLTTTNTNINPANSTLPITNEYQSTTSNYLSASSDSWCTSQSASCWDQSRLNTTNTAANIAPVQVQSVTSADAHASLDTTIYAYGNSYNWYSATAGYAPSTRGTTTPANGDICPAGWRLPYGGKNTSWNTAGDNKGGFNYLANTMGATSGDLASSKIFRSFPNNYMYSGSWRGTSSSTRGNWGYYWSSASYRGSSAYVLFLTSTSLGSSSQSDYYAGNSVRCVSTQ